jgi:hypothetical protein
MADTESRPAKTIIGGRHGSPSVTVALPFSKITTTDSETRAAVADLAHVVARLAEDPTPEERGVLASQAKEIAEQMSG